MPKKKHIKRELIRTSDASTRGLVSSTSQDAEAFVARLYRECLEQFKRSGDTNETRNSFTRIIFPRKEGGLGAIQPIESPGKYITIPDAAIPPGHEGSQRVLMSFTPAGLIPTGIFVDSILGQGKKYFAAWIASEVEDSDGNSYFLQIIHQEHKPAVRQNATVEDIDNLLHISRLEQRFGLEHYQLHLHLTDGLTYASPEDLPHLCAKLSERTRLVGGNVKLGAINILNPDPTPTERASTIIDQAHERIAAINENLVEVGGTTGNLLDDSLAVRRHLLTQGGCYDAMTVIEDFIQYDPFHEPERTLTCFGSTSQIKSFAQAISTYRNRWGRSTYFSPFRLITQCTNDAFPGDPPLRDIVADELYKMAAKNLWGGTVGRLGFSITRRAARYVTGKRRMEDRICHALNPDMIRPEDVAARVDRIRKLFTAEGEEDFRKGLRSIISSARIPRKTWELD